MATLGDVIRAQRNLHHMSLRQLARTTGISNPYLSQIERGLREPSDAVVEAIAGALDLTTERLYDAAGIRVQEGAEEAGPVREAILADPDLKPPQRRALLETYDAFLIANGGPRRRTGGSSRARSAPPDAETPI